MNDIVTQTVESIYQGQKAFCKFLTANDTGATGAHQAGIYISKPSISILFNESGTKGENKDKWVTIKWQNDFETKTRFIYYGQGTRNEYRITNFGSGFPFLRHEFTGALFVLIKNDDHYYQAFVLNTDEDIDEFLGAFALSPTETNQLINVDPKRNEIHEKNEIDNFIASLSIDFPLSEVISAAARSIQNTVYNNNNYIITNPDRKLIEWTDVEYRLFRALEYARYQSIINNGFKTIEEFIGISNQVLNRRKSRAGKSLEHHLAAIFDGNKISYQAQGITEGNKKPDFIFPSQSAYQDINFPIEKLNTLAAKTTCKDRWRQIINEADRLKGRDKFLCTLQQGISTAQMDEMQSEKVILVVPKPYISTYPRERQHRIWTIKKFVEYVHEAENL